MAVRDYASVQNALSTLITDVSMNINRAVIGAQIAPVRQGAMKSVTWDAQVGSENGTYTGGAADGADVTNYDSDDYLPATLEYVTYRAPFAINGRAYAQARAVGTPEALRDLFVEGMTNAGTRLASKLGTDFYTGLGSGSNQLHGLFHATIPAIGDVGVYAGIDRATYAQWQGTVINAAGARLSEGLIAQLDRGIFTKSGFSGRVFITDPIQFDIFGSLLGDRKQYRQEVTIAGQTITLGAGWQALEWRGNAIIRDQKMPAGYFAALTPEQLAMWSLDPNGPMYGAQGTMMVGGTPEEQGMGDRRIIQVRLQPLARTGDKYPFALYAYVQQQVRRPQAHGYIYGLSQD